MSSGEKVMVGVGAAVVVGMLLVATFSLGVYVGEHGWTWQGVSLAGPGGRPGGPAPGQGLPPGQPGGQFPGGPALPSGPPDLVGQVRGLEGGVLHLATRDGPRAVEVTEQTEVQTAQGETAGLEAVQPGTSVAVFGHPGEHDRTLLADVVIILPPPQNAP